ncbi:MAG: ribbon-helix-helix protein, CopG family [Gammaproteobacteria bacterium]|nr:ribbon-helix-helix protein, CopG family [Gammaproteobacteria bacterium]
MIEKKTKGHLGVLERAKVSHEMADFITKEAVKTGASRSQIIRDALTHYMSYEQSKVLAEVQSLKVMTADLNQRLLAMGQYEQARFDQLLKAVKAYRKPLK